MCPHSQYRTQKHSSNKGYQVLTDQLRMHQVIMIWTRTSWRWRNLTNYNLPDKATQTTTLQNPVVWMFLRMATVTRSSPYKRVVGGSMHQEVAPQCAVSQHVRLPLLELAVLNTTTTSFGTHTSSNGIQSESVSININDISCIYKVVFPRFLLWLWEFVVISTALIRFLK